VPTHFSQQNSSKVASQPKAKEESPSKAGMNKRRKLKNKRRRSLRKYFWTFLYAQEHVSLTEGHNEHGQDLVLGRVDLLCSLSLCS